TVPYLGASDRPAREEVALFEVSGGVIVADRFDALAVKDGLVECRGLAAGDYDLILKRDGARGHVRVTDGPAVGGPLGGEGRQLQVPGLKPVQIKSVTGDEQALTVRLTDSNRFARVHVFATRYMPAFPAFENLARVRDAEPGGVVPTRPESV